MTTLYFEADKEDDLRRVGYSKERRVDPQIIVGLLVDRGGFPLRIGCWEGDRAETTTIVPVVREFVRSAGIEHLVVVADAGMLSAADPAALDEAGVGFIAGSRMTRAPVDLAAHFRFHGDVLADGQIIDTITPRRGGRCAERDENLRDEPVRDPATHPGSWRAVWVYSAKRFARDSKTLTAQESRARAVVAGRRRPRGTRFARRPPGRPGGRRGRTGPRQAHGGPEGPREQHPRRRHGGRRGDRLLPRAVARGAVVPHDPSTT